MRVLAKVVITAAVLASPAVLHLAPVLHWPGYVTALCLGLQMAILLALVVTQLSPWWKWLLAGAIAALAAGLAWQFGERGVLVSAGIPHTAAHGTLLTLFALSLRPGGEPVITAIMRRVRGPLTGELAAYGRAVTLAWALFFAGQLAVSAALLIFAPLDAWSFFINVVNLPSILAMFAGEYLYRRLRFRHLRHTRVQDMVRGFMAWRKGVATGPVGEGARPGEC